MDIDSLTGIVVDICIKIHSKIGPGCLKKCMKSSYIMN